MKDVVIEKILKKIKKDKEDYQAYEDCYLLSKDMLDKGDKDGVGYLVELSESIESNMLLVSDDTQVKLYGLHKKVLKASAKDLFESFLLYSEWDREPSQKFYPPRRKQLRVVVQALQDLADRKLELLCISEPPGIGKTTLALFYITWRALREPEKTVLTGSHSSSLVAGMYEECLRFLDPRGDYLCTDVFGYGVEKQNAKMQWINIGKNKRFATLEFTSIGSQNAGQYRASGLLYTDDLVSGIEEAMSRDRLDKLWQGYTTDLRQRMLGNPPPQQLVIATRWSVHDPIGRLQTLNEGNEKAKFISFSALNENDESNFDYAYGVGYSTDFLLKQRDSMDEVSWRALYMNEPIEREGLLYEKSELRRYFELPDEEPDAVIAVCDTKDKGNDYCCMPIIYQYGSNYFVESIVCNNGKVELVDEELITRLIKHKVNIAQFESNSAGGRVAKTVQDGVTARGGFTKIVTKYTTANKETKIMVESPFVKDHFLFKDDSVADKEYKMALNMLCGYSLEGKNKHDDVPDAFAQASLFIKGQTVGKVEVFARPF